MRINGKFILKAVVYAFIYIIFVVLETNIFNELKIFGAKPNIIISLIAAAAVLDGEKYSAVLGLIFGIATDCGFDSPFLLSGLYYFFGAYCGAIVAKIYFTRSPLTMFIISAPFIAGREIFNLFFLAANWRDFEIVKALTEYILPEYLYSLALAPIIYVLVKFTAGKINYKIYDV